MLRPKNLKSKGISKSIVTKFARADKSIEGFEHGDALPGGEQQVLYELEAGVAAGLCNPTFR
jgi:hypothetical protein